MFLLVDYYAGFISWAWTSNGELGTLTFKICVVDEMLLDLCTRSNNTYSIFIRGFTKFDIKVARVQYSGIKGQKKCD